MKKLSLILILATVILGVYGCDGDSEPTELPDNSFKIEQFRDDNLQIYSLNYNDYDDRYYMFAYDKEKHKHNVYISSDEGENFELLLQIDNSGIGFSIMKPPSIVIGKDGCVFVSTKEKFYRYSPSLQERTDLFKNSKLLDAPYGDYSEKFLYTWNNVLAIDSDGIIYKGNTYKSTDNGATWTTMNLNPAIISQGSNMELLIKNNILVAYNWLSNFFYISSDKGETWSDLTMQYKDIDSSYFAYYDVNNITSANPKPYTIKKSDDKISNILGIDKYGNVIGETFGKAGKLFDPEKDYYFSSSNMGESWKYHFNTYLAWSFYTPSGSLYFGTIWRGTFRSKTPLR